MHRSNHRYKRILLIVPPEVSPPFNTLTAVLPNMALASFAGILMKRGYEVRIAELYVKRRGVASVLKRIIKDFDPGIVGISAMTFQWDTAVKIAGFLKSVNHHIITIAGGLHCTTLYDEIYKKDETKNFDFIIRGEGEKTLTELVDALQTGCKDFSRIAGLSYQIEGSFHDNSLRSLMDLNEIDLPERDCRLFEYGGKGWKRGYDVVETSRGCLMDCNFCSINKLYGKSFRTFSLDRVIEDIKRVKERGGRGVFFTDDNICLDMDRFHRLCEMIIENDLHKSIKFSTEASTRGLSLSEETSILMRRANFKSVFLGIDGINEMNLKVMKKGNHLEHSIKTVRFLKKNEINIIGGIIVGWPEDREEEIRAAFEFCRKYHVDLPMVFVLTPFPGTDIRRTLLEKDLIINKDDFSKYNGFSVNIKTKHLQPKQIKKIMDEEYVRAVKERVIYSRHPHVKPEFSLDYLIKIWKIIKTFFLFSTGRWSETKGFRFESLPSYYLKKVKMIRRRRLRFKSWRIQNHKIRT